MKSLIASFLLIFASESWAYCQEPLRCIYSESYLFLRGDEEIKKSQAIAACFTEGTFAFYSAEIGLISFSIQGPIFREVKNGVTSTSFSNQENQLRKRGYYDVLITYGEEKTIVINNSKSGTAIVLTADNFAGSQNQFIKNHIKSK